MAMTADQLPDDPDALKAMVLARDVENARLIQIIKELQRHRFGRRAEKLPEDQLLLGLEEAEQIEAAGEEAAEVCYKTPPTFFVAAIRCRQVADPGICHSRQFMTLLSPPNFAVLQRKGRTGRRAE